MFCCRSLEPLACRWGADGFLNPRYEHAWAILTDLAPEEAEVSWYHMRTWVETGYKDIKRGLWGWHHSKMLSAHRIERLWLAIAVAQVWSVSVGCLAELAERICYMSMRMPLNTAPSAFGQCLVSQGRCDSPSPLTQQNLLRSTELRFLSLSGRMAQHVAGTRRQ